LAAATGSERTLATKVRYLINRLFVLLGWNIDDVLLRRFLSSQFSRPGSRHSIINFNYDLFTDRVVQEIEPSWSVTTGYAITIGGCVYSDPEAGPPGPDVKSIDKPISEPNVLIVKPHGSLNWLVPLEHGLAQGQSGLLFANHPPVVPLEPDGRLRYCAATSNFQYIYPPNDDPFDVLPAIVPPVKSKDMALPLFGALQNAERMAIQTADEIYVIGWSMPPTDDNQIDLMRAAVATRNKPPQLVTIVNRGENAAYFARMANVFGVDRSMLSIFNDGFSDFVTATT